MKTKEEMLSVLGRESRSTAEQFDALGESLGGKQIQKEGPKSYKLVYYKPVTKRTLFTMDFNEKRFWLRGNLRHIGQYIDIVDAAPEDLVAQIKKPRECSGCNPTRCEGGVAFFIDGENHNACQGSAFVFKDLSKESWDIVQTLVERESTIV